MEENDRCLRSQALCRTLRSELAARVQRVRPLLGRAPTLALVRIGENASDLAYAAGIQRQASNVGADIETFVFPVTVNTAEVKGLVTEINRRGDLDGCLLLRPFPKDLDDALICRGLSGEKDLDGVSDSALAALYAGRPCYAPCTAEACLRLLDHYRIPLEGRKVLVIGRSLVIGKPVAMLLLDRHATVRIAHSRSRELGELCRDAEIILAAAGKRGLFHREDLSPDQVLIDIGIHDDGKGGICGDLDAELAERVGLRYSPVPGGLGPVTSLVLMEHLIQAAEMRLAARPEMEGETS